MDKITPHLWFDTEAVEAAEFYAATFPDSKVIDVTTIPDTPSGDTDVVTFQLCGQTFQAISAGPLFSFNPSVSFAVSCDTVDEVDRVWARLADGGTVLVPLDSYPFSERYGWTQDRYGLSWQLAYAGGAEVTQRVTPTLTFVGDVSGKTEEAIVFYTSVFPDSKVGDVLRYGAGQEPDVEGTVQYAAFRLAGQEFAAMDSARDHHFGFNEAISFIVNCDSQDEIDRYWDPLGCPGVRAVRLAQGPVRALVADRPVRHGRDAPQWHEGTDRTGHSGVSGDEEVRPRRAATGVRGNGDRGWSASLRMQTARRPTASSARSRPAARSRCRLPSSVG